VREPDPSDGPFGKRVGGSFWRGLSRTLGDAFGLSSDRDEPITYVSAPDVPPPRPSALPGFHRTASDQLHRGTAESFAALRAKLLNAYTPARPVVDRRMFAGRTGIMQTLIHAIEEQRLHVVIYGERGVGKSSLLQLVSQAAKDARYLVAYIDCGQRSEFDETFRALAANIPLMFHRAYGPTSIESERGDTLAGLLGPEPITVGAATEALCRIEGTRVLLILDDFDHTGSEEFRYQIAELLKSLSDQAVHVQALIAGVPAELAKLVGHVPSLHRNVLAMQVPRMVAGEIRDLIRKGEAVSDVRFDAEAVHAIVAACAGSPYLAKLLSYRAALAAVEDGRRAINAHDVGASMQNAIDELRKTVSRPAQFQVDELTQRGRLAVLGALAGAAQSTGGWFTMEDVTTALGDDPTPLRDVDAVVQALAGQSILIEVEDDAHDRLFRFAAPTLPDYLSLLAARRRSSALIAPARDA
jgi:Cdc6-like AAA superfamily ATPase